MSVVVIGGGPAGLMAAETLAAAGRKVTVYERMATPGRKLLIAGRGGLNLTHSEPIEHFLARYGEAASWLRPILEAFPPSALIAWAEGLGQPTFVGSSGRVFPKSLKASPLLRAWLARLAGLGVELRTRHDWRGWNERGNLIFAVDGKEIEIARPAATVLALGGASWPKLGSTGDWANILSAQGVAVTRLRPSNCGFRAAWSPAFRERFSGSPLKPAVFSFGQQRVRGEAVITASGIEGGAVYALSAALRDAIESKGEAMLEIDLSPDAALDRLCAKLDRPARGQSFSTFLRKSARLSPVAINLLREAHAELAREPAALAGQIKAVRIPLLGTGPIERAISTAGGVSRSAVDARLGLRTLPDVFVAGEMLDWEAPTGGYLLQASLATGAAAAKAILTA
ncbi:MAG: TIGR03862 family flavoprotein [Alphaproteobacteria bacterium]|nr:TIGR03862 family flavoprotein [Alphaproteobacteria bacterium]